MALTIRIFFQPQQRLVSFTVDRQILHSIENLHSQAVHYLRVIGVINDGQSDNS